MSAVLMRVLAESSLRSALVALSVAAVLGALRVRTASLRHGAWTAVLCAMLLMPALPSAVPAIDVPLSLLLPEPLARNDPEEDPHMGVRDDRRLEARRTLDVRPGAPPRAATATAVPASDMPKRDVSWPLAALCVYGAGVLLFSLQCGLAWWKAARIVRAGRPVDSAAEAAPERLFDAAVIRESAAIVTPVTAGAIRPTILLPVEWRSWSSDRLRAIVAHEIAHVRRRDPLVSLLAHVNRCLFWFHPAAWWLERTLAAEAERASDAEAVRAIGARDTYVDILLEMARLIRHRGGRLAWRGVGIDGGGLLGRRIDDVLSGASTIRPSRSRKAAVAACCAGVIFLVVACRPEPVSRQSASTMAIEQRDRKLRLDLEQLNRSEFASVWEMVGSSADLPDVAVLEDAVERNPEDLAALKALLVTYWVQPPSDLTRRRARILWLVEHHPDADLAGSIGARLFPSELDPSFPGDPEGFQQARALWISLANAPNASRRAVGHAVSFFEATDSPLAEQLILRARASDPSGPWTARLGRLYAGVLTGFDAPSGRNRLRTLRAGAPQSALGLGVRKTLGVSTDVELLTAAGWYLAHATRGPFREGNPDVWAEWCFTRALQLNPGVVLAHSALLEMRSRERWVRGEPLWSAPPAQAYESVAALPEAERFETLPRLARAACERIESIQRWDDDPLIRDRMALARQQAQRFAEDALTLAPKYRHHPQYGTAIYLANMTLGTLALRDGDRKKASLFLRNASRAPASEELAYANGIVSDFHWHLAADLLKQGERDAVLDFLDRMAGISVAERLELREAAEDIRHGRMPRL